MFTQTSQPGMAQHTTINEWWQHIREEYDLFFTIMRNVEVAHEPLLNYKGFIRNLKRSYDQVLDAPYPPEANQLRTHLVRTMQYMIESLNLMDDRQSFGGQIRLDVARTEYNILMHTALAQGISDIA